MVSGVSKTKAMKTYVHGYSEKEIKRLADQADTLAELLHFDTSFASGSNVLEAGCGTGAQTVFLAQNSPGAQITAIDISQDSINQAQAKTVQAGIDNVSFHLTDIYNLPFGEGYFDHIFVCFVLEHLQDPLSALIKLQTVLKKGGTLTVIEGDHGSFYCYPQSKEAFQTVRCLIDIQARLNGNSLIGRQLYPLLKRADLAAVDVSPRMVYVDASKPALVDGFTKKTFIAMVEGVEQQALSLGLINKKTWDTGIKDLYRTTQADGTFCYTFFKGKGVKRP